VNIHPIMKNLQGGLVVSCQAYPGEPTFGPQYMVAMALSAIQGGAVGLRINGPVDVSAVKGLVSSDHFRIPVIGLFKEDLPGYRVRITPTLKHCLAIAAAGADIIALDATLRPHPDGLEAGELVRRVRVQTGLPVLADISTLEEGLAAEQAGADAISTTLSGYTAYSPQQEGPDLNIVAALAKRVSVPVLAEGRIDTPQQARMALEAGAFAVVVGSAITRPWLITEKFVKGLR
jgi:N-acylglucosamine-6-phosphate 2-epimerase